MEVVVELEGDWMGAQFAVKAIPVLIRTSADWAIRKESEKLVKIVKNHINNQDLDWEPLSPSTSTGDPRILVDTEAYYRAIKAWRSNFVWYTGVDPNAYNDRGTRIMEYALAHEYGLGHMPPRPLWEPSIAELGSKEQIAKRVAMIIMAKVAVLKTKGFDVDFGL